MSDTTIIFIVSPPYSGSTLLTMLLATHPAIGTLGERGHFYRKMMVDPIVGSAECSCGTPFRECALWTTAYADVEAAVPGWVMRVPFPGFYPYKLLPRKVHGRLQRLLLGRASEGRSDSLPFPVRGRYQAVLAANAELIRSVLRQSNATVFLDSSKVVNHAVFLNDMPGFEVKVLHLVRDGRGQVDSALKHHPERDVVKASAQWKQQIRKQHAVLQRAKLPTHMVQYEALCANPRGTVESALAFCGLDGTQATLDVAGTPLHIMGNPMRLRDVSEIVDRQAWRERLTPDQLMVFEDTAGDINRLLGYA